MVHSTDETQRSDRSGAWTPDSWRSRPAEQLPDYDDPDHVRRVVDRLSVKPPLVTPWEIDRLRTSLAAAAMREQFLLQGGDCAELFDECRPDIIGGRLKVLLQMSIVLIYGLRIPVIRVGRFAGQYAKPRSENEETRKGVTLPSYRGDIVNRPAFTTESRRPDPDRLMLAYDHSAATLNHIRALGEGGFADLHHPENWNLGFVRQNDLRGEYQEIVDAIQEAIRFMEAVSPGPLSGIERVPFYTSHEALLLPYEEAMTRMAENQRGMYNLSTHFPWVGVRTSLPDGAHIEYLRGIRNPIGMKVGPGMSPSDLVSLLIRLDPNTVPGRITLITRFGADRIETCLPGLIEAVQASGRQPLWSCDPMHGNTESLDSGVKTRRFENIQAELEMAFDVHKASGSTLGGVHLELTGENVTECTGGARGIGEDDLARAYRSQVDPRLNGEQALELAFSIIRKRRRMREES